MFIKGNNKTDTTILPLICGGIALKDIVEKANCLNEYFKSVFVASSGNADNVYIADVDTNLMLPIELDIRVIEKLLAQLKVGEALGTGFIPPIFLSKTVVVLWPVICL